MHDAYLFEPPPQPTAAVVGEGARYPVRRIFCVGRNYEDHAREMGAVVDREAPFYFTKPASALTPSGATVPYAAGTRNLHHEVELVVALGAAVFRAKPENCAEAVYGFAVGLDMTRRDLQQAAKDKSRPWDLAKAFEHSAALGAITKRGDFGAVGARRITLSVNGAPRQDQRLSALVWSVEELIAHLSGFYHLGPGDLIFTGTPAGVGPVVPGDVLRGEIEGLEPLMLTIGEAE